MDAGNSIWHTRIAVGLPLLATASLGFIGVLLALEIPAVLPVALGGLVAGLSSAALLSMPLSRSIARKIAAGYILIVGTLLLAHIILILLPDYFGLPRPYVSYIPEVLAPYSLALPLVLQGGPLVSGLTLGFSLRILGGEWPRFKLLVHTERRNPQTIAALIAAALSTLTFVSDAGYVLWHRWSEVLRDAANLQLNDAPMAWASAAFMLTLFAIGMVARALGCSSRGFWNRLVAAFAIMFVPAWSIVLLTLLAPAVAHAPALWLLGAPAFAFYLLVLFLEAACVLLLGAWTMALLRRR